MIPNRYLHTALFYDLDPRPIANDDIVFFLELAAEARGPVLDLGCGTGRVALKLAEAGYEVEAVDGSAEMLHCFQSKLREVTPEVRERIKIVRSDFTEFDSERRFPLVLIPRRGFQVLVSDEAITNFLGRIRKVMLPSGKLVLDVFLPNGPMDASWPSSEQFDWEVKHGAQHIRRSHRDVSINLEERIIESELIYDVSEGDETSRHLERCLLRYYFPADLFKVVEENGFFVEAAFGYYDGRPIERGPEQILVCRVKAEGDI